VTALSDQALTSVEIIVNGEVARSFELADRHELAAEAELEITRGSWIAARCTARDDLLTDEELALYAHGESSHPFRQRPSRLRFAHTSPIYVTVGGKSPAVRKSIEEGLLMLDRFEDFSRQTADAAYLPATLDAVSEARDNLKARLNGSIQFRKGR